MRQNRTIKNMDGKDIYISFETEDECPICQKSIEPIYLSAFKDVDNTVGIFYFCKGCGKSFLSRYTFAGPNSEGASQYRLKASFPKSFKPTEFSETISGVSSQFVNIYNQSKTAELLNLDEIAGIGFRKALEFLVKDYAILRNPDQQGEIAAMHLQGCIKKFITHPRTQEVLSKAVWVGNDETHYQRKIEGSDIDLLKKLIDLSIHWISMDLESEKTVEFVTQNATPKK
ncbi:MAG: hypothetical protein AB9921_06040 [Erysipelotrichaceae bacterium]